MQLNNKFSRYSTVYWWADGSVESFQVEAVAIYNDVIYYSDSIHESFISEDHLYATAKECWHANNWEEEPDREKIYFDSKAGEKFMDLI